MTTTTKKKPLDHWQRVILFSIAAWAFIGFSVNFVHEFGHMLFCPGESYMGITSAGGYTVCMAPATILYNIGGGLFGSIAMGTTAFITWRYHRQKLIGVFVAAVAILIDQVMKIFVEGFYPAIYMSGTIDGWITLLQMGSLAGLIIWFARRKPD